jgi:hypothetical protein
MLGEIIFAQFAELYAMKMVNAIGIAANAAVVRREINQKNLYTVKIVICAWKRTNLMLATTANARSVCNTFQNRTGRSFSHLAII